MEQPSSTTAPQDNGVLYNVSSFGKLHFVACFADKIILQLQELNTGISVMTDTLWRTNAKIVT